MWSLISQLVAFAKQTIPFSLRTYCCLDNQFSQIAESFYFIFPSCISMNIVYFYEEHPTV